MARLSRTGTIAYSCGQLAAGLYGAFNTFTLPLYLSLFTQNNILIGWLSSMRSFEQSIIQPIVGARSDRTWTRLGRRAPFFLAAMPVTAGLLFVNSLIPHDPAWLGMVIVTIFGFSLFFNIGIDPYYALMIDATSIEQRGTVSGIAQVFNFAGNIVILIAAAWLWATQPALVFFLVGGGLLLGFGIVALGVRERREAGVAHVTPTHTQPSAAATRGLRLLHYVQTLWRTQREAMKLLGVKFLYEFGVNAALPFLTLFVVEEIGLNGWSEVVAAAPLLAMVGLDRIDAQGLSQLIAAFLLLMTLLAAIPSGMLGDRFGKKNVLLVGLLLVGVFALLSAFATRVPQLLFYLVFLGLGNGARIVLFLPYLAELIPHERVGEFTGLTAFAETGGVFLSITLAGELLNLNLFDLQYRLVFVVTGVFLLLGAVALCFVKSRLLPVEADRMAHETPLT